MSRKDYEERREARIERYKELTDKHREASQAAYNRSSRLVEHIPFGQPTAA